MSAYGKKRTHRMRSTSGAGLVLIGRDGSLGAVIPVATRFLFVLSDKATLANAAKEDLPSTPPDERSESRAAQ
jgi:hypothetical protein